MRWVLGLLVVVVIALGGAWAAGLISFGGSQPSAPGPVVATSAPQPGSAPANAAAPATAPAPGESEPLRPENQPETRPVMQLQVVLDRQGFSPGVIDNREGMSLKAALRGFQRAHGLTGSGEVDDATRAALAQWDRIPSTQVVTIAADFAAGPFNGPIPHEPEDQARLQALGYSDLTEKLAERYHTTPDTLRALNPGFDPRAGAQIVVPNIRGGPVDNAPDDRGWRATLTSLGVAGEQPRAARVVVDKSDKVLMAYDAEDHLIAQFPATMGSTHDPLPLGRWEIRETAHNPPFHYNPALFWDASPGERRQTLPPGPNGPVGVVWIDLSKEHYGIHGTPEPQTIGRTQSHGCIRLTNWDAARLAQMVRPGVAAVFQE